MSVIITRTLTNTSFEFDLVEEESYDESVTITEHPIEYGGNVSDHAQAQPIKISMKLQITESPIAGIHPIGAFGPLRSYLATKFLQECKGKDLTVTTLQDGTFINMFIESIRYSKNIIKNRVFDVSFKQIRYGKAQFAAIPPKIVAKASKGASTEQDAGNQATKASPTKEKSVLSRITNYGLDVLGVGQ